MQPYYFSWTRQENNRSVGDDIYCVDLKKNLINECKIPTLDWETYYGKFKC